MFLSPAYIQKSIIERLKIKSCSQCDLLRDNRQTWKPLKKKKPRKELSYQYQCNSDKCCGLVRADYLTLNGAIIIGNEATEILEKRKCKNVPNSLYEPSEIPRQRSFFIDKREEENQALMTEIADVIRPNENSQTTENTDESSTEKKLIKDIEAVFQKHMYRMHGKTKAHMLYNIICNDDECLFKGKVHDVFVDNVLTGKFKDFFKPWRILQTIDSTSGGTVNYSGIDSLRDAL